MSVKIVGEFGVGGFDEKPQLLELVVDRALVLFEVVADEFDEACKGPEGIHLVFHYHLDGRQQVTHALHIAQVEVVHAVGEEDVLQHLQIRIVSTLKEGMVAVGAPYVLVCGAVLSGR